MKNLTYFISEEKDTHKVFSTCEFGKRLYVVYKGWHKFKYAYYIHDFLTGAYLDRTSDYDPQNISNVISAYFERRKKFADEGFNIDDSFFNKPQINKLYNADSDYKKPSV